MSCSVCFSSFEDVKPIQLSCSCVHCSDCLVSWIKMQTMELEYHTYESIKCMNSDCRKPFKVQEILSEIPDQLRKTLDQSLLDFYLRSTKDIRKCPKENCDFAGIIDVSNSCGEEVACSKCDMRWREKVNYSPGETVLNLLADLDWRSSEIFSNLWEEFYTNKCPTCNVSIEKNGGCPHMTCKKCGYEFCWYCKQAYDIHLSKMCIIQFLTKVIVYGIFFSHILSLTGIIPVIGNFLTWTCKVVLKTGALNGFLFTFKPLIWNRKKCNMPGTYTKSGILAYFGAMTAFGIIIYLFDIYLCLLKILVIEAFVFVCIFTKRIWLDPWIYSVY